MSNPAEQGRSVGETQPTEPAEIDFGETIYPFRDGVRFLRDDEESWSIPGETPGLIGKYTPYLKGVGRVTVELPFLAEDDDCQIGMPIQVVQIDPQEGRVYVADLVGIMPVVWYDNPNGDRNIECHLIVGGISLRSENSQRGLQTEVEEAGFADWEDAGGQRMFLQAPLDPSSEDQRDNRILQAIGIRFERVPQNR